ncbi:hypothetical protein [Hymenobacter lapidiphilus]|uniref:Uncharacterized protein n=1 Tax=Hymenobacter lapidiphilus TaxID=2608003 RepID=A0A7Y7PSL9_9BACT|nr:hypothetical protein [Hymenobacter lapidiphilus]NVO33279.1 hypothetical protein [Hymenobacter lapidiphilus]
MDRYPELTLAVRSALASLGSTPTETLLALYHECFGEACRRRDRMARRLGSWLNTRPVAETTTATLTESSSTLTTSSMPVSENFRFKASYKAHKAIVHAPETRYVDASNLQDADVPTLQAYDRGHMVEPIPGREKQAAAALAELTKAQQPEVAEDQKPELPTLNVNKAELQAIYAAEIGSKPADELTVDQLKDVLTKHRNAPAK